VDTKEILTKARELIADEKNWTQGALARDKNYCMVSFNAEAAVCFCALGAIFKTCSVGYETAIHELSHASEGVGITHVNDVFGHMAVMKMYDRAIERAK